MRKLALSAALLATAALSSCGGDDKEDVSAYIGSWKISMGKTTISRPANATPSPIDFCGMAPPTDLKDQLITITTGTDSDLVATLSGCSVKYNVSGTVATVVAGQMPCSFNVMFGMQSIPAMLTTTNANITFAGNMATYIANGSGTASFNGLSVTCMLSSNATATKQ